MQPAPGPVFLILLASMSCGRLGYDPVDPDIPGDAIQPTDATNAGDAQPATDAPTPIDAGPIDPADASPATCGDGTVEGIEVCDDGNNMSGDGCRADCLSTEICGNNQLDTATGEDCDTGGASATCDSDCTFVSCGDGTVNPAAGEVCDAGGNTAACDGDCTTAVCGDNYTNPAAGEVCDVGGIDVATCDSDCTAVTCGDNHVNTAAGEQCDDGNGKTGDGCTPSCLLEGA